LTLHREDGKKQTIVSDKITNIAQLKARVRKFVNDRDWVKYHNPKDVAVSIAIETAELLGLFQWVKGSELDKVAGDPARSAQLEEELADIMIYCLSLTNVLNLDVSQAITDWSRPSFWSITQDEFFDNQQNALVRYERHSSLYSHAAGMCEATPSPRG
jgi:NTP pyrophosphatase (non-canonical NTP hydrolase)